jgi:trk system potassium uptake protein
MERWYQKLEHLSPAQLLLAVFAVTIFAGSVLLRLPVSVVEGARVSYLDALFTSASAVCVTGLVVVDTGSVYSRFGQMVILALIQAGGLGIMTFASIGFKLVGAKLPLTHQMALEDTFYQRSAAQEFLHTFPRILKLLAWIQGLGFLSLAVGMLFSLPPRQAMYSAFFHTISAFCNAGFSIYPDSLTRFADNPLVMGATMLLIILGGLGYLVLVDLYTWAFKRKESFRGMPFRFSFHSRVVLMATGVLILGGMLVLLVAGVRTGSIWGSLNAALFQSVTARTAGFNTVDIGSLPLAALLLLTILMFIGAAPGSCAGGIKVTSFAIWMARIRSALHGEASVCLLRREIPTDLVLRAVAVVGLATTWNVMGVMLLSVVMPKGTNLAEMVFEQISAFGTVGLSTGLTALLPPVARVWIIMTMFIGRLGPITLLFCFITKRSAKIKYAEGRVMIG